MPLPAEWLSDIQQRASKCKKITNTPVTVGHNPGTGHTISLTDVFKKVTERGHSIAHMVDVANVDGDVHPGVAQNEGIPPRFDDGRG